MKKKLLVPKFNTEEEEQKFWDENDLGEFFEAHDMKSTPFPNLKKPKKLISLRLSEDMLDALKKEAEEKDIPYQTLIRVFIKQGLTHTPSVTRL